jgi:hypothetical protein
MSIIAKERKFFFSVEKKQETFANDGVCAACTVRDSNKQKSFASFLQKRRPSFLPKASFQ